MKEQQLSQRPDTLQPPLGPASASHSRSRPPAETRGHPSAHSVSVSRRGRDETDVSVFCTCRRPVKCTACMLIGVQTGQILRIHHASWGRPTRWSTIWHGVSLWRKKEPWPAPFSAATAGSAAAVGAKRGSLANIPQRSMLNLFLTPGGAPRSTNIKAKHIVLAGAVQGEL